MLKGIAEFGVLTAELVEIAQEVTDAKQKLKWIEQRRPKNNNPRKMQKWFTDAQPHVARVKELGERAVKIQARLAVLMKEAGLPVPVDAMEETQRGLDELLALSERWCM